MPNQEEIPALTGLRGVAAYSVLAAHAINFSGTNHPALTNLAYFGMSLFFTLSGFVLQYNYGRAFATKSFLGTAGQFLLARFARLYPLYFAGMVLSVGFIPGSDIFTTPWIAAACLTLTQTWLNVSGATGDVISGAWSISTEFGLYLLFIPLARLIARSRRPLLWLGLVCIAAVATIGFIASLSDPDQFLAWADTTDNRRITAPPLYWFCYFGPMRAFEFFAGAFAAQAFIRTGAIRLPNAASAVALLYCALVISLGPAWNSGDAKGLIMLNFIFAPAIVVLMLSACAPHAIVAKFLSASPMLGAGMISYSVYLLQDVVFIALAHSFGGDPLLTKIAQPIAMILLTTALGYGVYTLYEAPARRWIRGLSQTQQRPLFKASDAV